MAHKLQWTDTRLAARKLMVVDGWPDQRIHDEADIGNGTIETVHEMIELGIPLPGEPAAPVYKKLPESYDALSDRTKVATKKRDGVPAAPSFDQSNLLKIVPRAFTTSSLTIWLAMQVAQKVWGWKVTDPGEFIDRFITTAMEAYGITLASYSIQPGVSTADQGDGQGEKGAGGEQGEVAEEEETKAEEKIFTGDET